MLLVYQRNYYNFENNFEIIEKILYFNRKYVKLLLKWGCWFMSKFQRRRSITDYINDHGYVSFTELKNHFSGVSDMTLRTDLRELDESGLIIRRWGGAKSKRETTTATDLYFKRVQRNHDKKLQIALKCVEYIKAQLDKCPNLTIYLDSGSTITEIANHFPNEWCTIVTGSISNAYALSALSKPTVIVNGGTLNRFNCCCDSATNLAQMERMNFDIMVLAVAGYSEQEGFTCVKEIMDEVRGVIMRQSKKVIIPIDSTKIGIAYPITHAKLDDVDIIVSDDGLPEQLRQKFISNGIEVL